MKRVSTLPQESVMQAKTYIYFRRLTSFLSRSDVQFNFSIHLRSFRTYRWYVTYETGVNYVFQ